MHKFSFNKPYLTTLVTAKYLDYFVDNIVLIRLINLTPNVIKTARKCWVILQKKCQANRKELRLKYTLIMLSYSPTRNLIA